MSAPQWGHVAEWLRSGLQNRLHQFNSGRGLQPNRLIFRKNSIHFCSVEVPQSGLLPGLLPFLFPFFRCRAALAHP